jgi:hypothetical protein
VRTADVLIDIQPETLSDMNLDRYRCAQLLGKGHVFVMSLLR